jgi:hypothetical protein
VQLTGRREVVGQWPTDDGGEEQGDAEKPGGNDEQSADTLCDFRPAGAVT